MAFCQSPEAYFEAYDDFYASLEQLEKRLSENRFLFGDYITDSDVRAYVTLVRWDVAYYHNVGPVLHPIYTYKNIFGYLKELNAIPEFHRYSNAHDLAFGSTPGVPENEETAMNSSGISITGSFRNLILKNSGRMTAPALLSAGLRTKNICGIRREKLMRNTHLRFLRQSGTVRRTKTGIREISIFQETRR